MTPITLIAWLLAVGFALALVACGLLALVAVLGAELRHLRVADRRNRRRLAAAFSEANESARDNKALRDEVRRLEARYEQLADLHAADRHLIDTFIPDHLTEDLT